MVLFFSCYQIKTDDNNTLNTYQNEAIIHIHNYYTTDNKRI